MKVVLKTREGAFRNGLVAPACNGGSRHARVLCERGSGNIGRADFKPSRAEGPGPKRRPPIGND